MNPSVSLLRGGRERELLRHGGLAFISMGAINGFAFVFYAAASRRLGVHAYGELYALLALLALAAIPPSILSTVITKYAAEFNSLELRDALHGFIMGNATLLWGISAFVVALGVAFQWQIADFLRVPVGTIVPTVLLIAIANLLPPFRAMLQGVQNFRAFALSGVLEGLLKTTLGVALITAGFGVTGAIVGYGIGSAIALAYTTWAALRGSWGARSRISGLDFPRLLRTLGGAAVLTITVNAIGYADVLLVKHYMSARDAGLYAAVSLGGKILFFAASFIPMVVLPKAADRSAAGDSPMRVLVVALTAWTILSIVGLAVFYALPGLILAVLVGKNFVSAAPLLFYYALAMVLLAGMYVTASFKIGLHRFDFVYPFALATVAEIGIIAAHHPDLVSVVATLVLGNAVAFVAGLWRVRGPTPQVARDESKLYAECGNSI